jgi:ssDNA-binding Zn-finger/Zn-ribbon topoisomerase 1
VNKRRPDGDVELEGGILLSDLFKPKAPEPVEDVTMDGPMVTRSIFPCERMDLKCGECQAPMKLRVSKKFDNSPFYGCSRFPDCKGTHGAHRDGRPLGTPADKATKKARIRAHRVFDMIWQPLPTQKAKMSRYEAYAWMRKKMGLSEAQNHIGKFSTEQCDQLIAHVQKQFPFVRTAWDRIADEDLFDEVSPDD